MDTNEKINLLDKIQFNCENEKEIVVLKSMCTVGKNSLQYWNKNFSKWNKEFGGKNRIKTKGWWEKLDFQELVISDAVGAGIGAVHLGTSGAGAALAAAGPGGWGAMAAVIVGYGIEGSAASALTAILS